MPSRKSDASSDAALSNPSRRTSLRRLSSIASLQNLFTRRRSQHVADPAVASSSSDLSLASSTLANASIPEHSACSTADRLQQVDSLTELPVAPPPSHLSTRRSSYICLPDDPIGGMPRSRTFSNLPVPARTKKTPAIVPPSRSHARLPSAYFPNTRLPSPPSSTRKHSRSRLMSAETRGQAPVRTRMTRSDTEPLTGMAPLHPANSVPRSTAFKENISLSPIKPLPALDMFHQDKHRSNHYHPPGAWMSSSSDMGDVLSSSVSSTASNSTPPPSPISKYANHPAIQMVRGHRSSPARPLYRSLRDRPPTPGASSLNPVAQGAPFQRWNSQSILTTRQNNNENSKRTNSKHHGEIKQTRLMSTRQAPTPPPPKTPVIMQGIAAGSKMKGANNSASAGHVRQASEHTPSQPRSEQSSIPLPAGHLRVSGYEPPAYWAGRLSALADRYRNEELASLVQGAISPPTSTTSGSTASSSNSRGAASHLSFSSLGSGTAATLTPKAQTDKMHTPEASTARFKRALDHLNTLCATQEARDSLYAFQTQSSGMMHLPELRPPKLVLHLGDSNNTTQEGAGVAMMSESRKASFMDRLLGRGQGKRRSLVMG